MVCKNGNTLYSTQLAGGSIILAFEEDYKERNEPCNAQGSRLSSCYTIKVGQQYSAPPPPYSVHDHHRPPPHTHFRNMANSDCMTSH